MQTGFLTYLFLQEKLGNVLLAENVLFALPVLLLSLVSTALVVYGWLKKNTPMGKSYSIMMLALTSWLVIYSTRVLIPDAEEILSIIEYMVMVVLPVTWLFFTISFSNSKSWLTPGKISMILFVPLSLAVGVLVMSILESLKSLSDPYQSIGLLAYNTTGVDSESFIYTADNNHNILFYVHLAYSLIYFLIGTLLVIRSLRINKRLDRQQVTALYIGVLIPWAGNIILFVSHYSVFLNFLAPLIFVMSGALFAWGIYYNHFINIITLAHNVLVDRLDDGLIILDKLNWVLEINQTASAMFKTNKHSTVGHPIDTLYHDFPSLVPIVNHAKGKSSEMSVEVNHKLRIFNSDTIPLYSKKGVLAGKILLFKEITTLKETFRNLEKARSKADDADSLKSAFLANLSHEIKTPMNAIIGFSNLLNDVSIEDEERVEFIDHIRNSGSTLLQLIDDIMDISKMDAGQFTLQKGYIDLSKMMAELFARFNDHLISEGKTGIDLILDTENLSSDLNIVGDGERIRQILTNLLSNAVKFTKQGQIEFGYHLEKGSTVQFFVKDSGIGIPFDKHKMIFERFGRVYSSNQQEYTGTGLGLALSRGMVRLMGGHIWFESLYGKGSTFYFSIPFNEAKFEEIRVPKAEPVIEEPYQDPESMKVPFTPMLPSTPIVEPPVVKEEIIEEIPERIIEESIDKPTEEEAVELPPVIEEIAADAPQREVEPVKELEKEDIVIPEPTIDLDAESDPYLDFLFAQSDEKKPAEKKAEPVEKKEDDVEEIAKGIIEKHLQEKQTASMPEPNMDLDAEADPFLDALFATDDKPGQKEPEVQRASIRDHIKDMPEEADLIFDPEYAPTSTIEDETDFSGSKVLVVDYDDMSYLFIEMILRTTKIQMIRAKTFQQAMNLLKGGTDVTGVLLTSEVPDIELLPAIRRLKEKHPRHNIIAITPFANEERRQECLRMGCLNVLPKPVKQRELLAAVRNLHTISNM